MNNSVCCVILHGIQMIVYLRIALADFHTCTENVLSEFFYNFKHSTRESGNKMSKNILVFRCCVFPTVFVIFSDKKYYGQEESWISTHPFINVIG